MDMHLTIPLRAPSSTAWQVLGEEFGTNCEWSATLSDSQMEEAPGVGAVRSCMGTGFGPFPPGIVTETLTHFEPETMTFTYAASSGLPWFITHAENAWRIEPTGPQTCTVHSHATVSMVWWLAPMGGLMKRLMRGDADRFIEELQYRIETGEPHPRNQTTS